jgi:hypothetical protein
MRQREPRVIAAWDVTEMIGSDQSSYAALLYETDFESDAFDRARPPLRTKYRAS